jgi:beta-glucosidase
MATTIDRRTLLAATAGLLASPWVWSDSLQRVFPKGFVWGAATSGHQVEGNNVSSDLWFLEHLKGSAFREPSGDACNSLELWREDLDLARAMGLNAYRFSVEWARIEPEQGHFSVAMLDHYVRIAEGCRARGMMPVVTFNHFTAPLWFASRGGWLENDAPDLFGRYCEVLAKRIAPLAGFATTLNEPNLMQMLSWAHLPAEFADGQRRMLKEAAERLGVPRFSTANCINSEDWPRLQEQLMQCHAVGRAAIKSVRSSLPVGFSLAMTDDQAVGDPALRDRKRQEVYASWLELARHDDFVGVQNYERSRIGPDGALPPPDGVPRNAMGSDIYPASLAGAVRYAHSVARVPILVTEHGLGTSDDTLRANFIPVALAHLHDAMADGIPVLGYIHWTLIDNWEWIFGYGPQYGLHTVDRTTFHRTPKPSAAVLGAIARRNGL